MKTKHRFGFAVTALGLFVLSAAGGDMPRFIEITAELKSARLTIGFGGTSNAFNYGTSTVRCLVGTNVWSLEMDTPITPVASGSKPFNATTNVRQKFWFTGSNMVRETVLEGSGQRNRSTNNIAQGEALYPKSMANIAWLAFCSGPFLKTPGRYLYLPIDCPHNPTSWDWYLPDVYRDGDSNHSVHDRTTVFTEAPGLPKAVEWFESSAQIATWKRISYSFVAEGDYTPELPERYAYGFTILGSKPPPRDIVTLATNQLVCHYEVLEATNFLGWQLPLRFKVVRRGGPDDLYGGDPILESKIESVGSVKSFRVVDGPGLPGNRASER